MAEQIIKCAFFGLCMNDKFTQVQGMEYIKMTTYSAEFYIYYDRIY